VEEWRVYCYLGGMRRDNVVREWLAAESVSVAQIAAFQEKIDALEMSGPTMVPGFISETPVAKDIYKMKIKGNKGRKQLRPMCCRGPFGPKEYTILAGAVERDGKLVPENVKDTARLNLNELRADPTRRVHERLAPRPKG